MFVSHLFKLAKKTKELLYDWEPNFGYNGYGEFLFYRTYSRIKDFTTGEMEKWHDVVLRVVEGTLSIRKDWYIKNHIEWDESYWQNFAIGFMKYLFDMKWFPAGRGLWMMGTSFIYENGGMALANCFSGEVEILTKEGIKTLKELVGQEVELYVMTSQGMKWIKSIIKSYGKQKVYEMQFSDGENFKTTQNHLWMKANSDSTNQEILHPLNRYYTTSMLTETVPIRYQELPEIDFKGYAHGAVFGDGSIDTYWKLSRIDLFGAKDCLYDILVKYGKGTTIKYKEGTIPRVYKLPAEWKELPINPTKEYAFGFILGLISTDGKVQNSIYITNCDYYILKKIQKLARWVGLRCYSPRLDRLISPFDGTEKLLYSITISTFNLEEKHFLRWDQKENLISSKLPKTIQVTSITEQDKEEEVYCAEVPEYNNFTLANGVITRNCGFTDISNDIGADIHWAMDALMLGVGVGFYPERDDSLRLYWPQGVQDYIIGDSREGWIDCTKEICDSYTYPGRKKINPIYDNIREAGLPIKRFGGVTSGPKPLMKFHLQLTEYFERYKENSSYDSVRLKADCANATGCCVVAGNVRRSAELLKGKIRDKTFLDLKNLELNPERADISYMSNNSVELEYPEDFECLGEVAQRVLSNGEPGVINRINMRQARVGRDDLIKYQLKEDPATAFNPCGRLFAALISNN